MDQVSQTTNGQAGFAANPRDEFAAKIDFAIDRAQRSLLALQRPEGYWQAPLEANAEMNAEYIMFNRFMELEPEPGLEAKLKKWMLDTQQSDGSWTLFPGGEGHLSTSISAYFALKLTGMRAGDEPMMQARRWILSRGGIANSGTLARGRRLFSLRNALLFTDHVMRAYDHHHVGGLRARALRYAENWLLEHQDANGSWGGIEPCYLLSPMALKGLGYRNDHP